jgi:hypothetical protein
VGSRARLEAVANRKISASAENKGKGKVVPVLKEAPRYEDVCQLHGPAALPSGLEPPVPSG